MLRLTIAADTYDTHIVPPFSFVDGRVGLYAALEVDTVAFFDLRRVQRVSQRYAHTRQV